MSTLRQILTAVALVLAALLLLSLATGTPEAAGDRSIPHQSGPHQSGPSADTTVDTRPSLSADDETFLAQVREGAPRLTAIYSDADLLDFTRTLQEACLMGEDVVAIFEEGETGWRLVESGNFARLVVAIYCTPRGTVLLPTESA